MPVTIAKKLTVESPAFQNNADIPKKYTCDGEGINPPISIIEFPEKTKSFAIIVEDPDAPSGTFDHWLVWNIEPGHDIPENFKEGVGGNNSRHKIGYMGPCPPSGKHRYYFKIYALDITLDLNEGADKKSLMREMDKHILAEGEIMGKYGR